LKLLFQISFLRCLKIGLEIPPYGLIIFQQTIKVYNWQYAIMLRRSFKKGNARQKIQDRTHDVKLCAKKKVEERFFIGLLVRKKLNHSRETVRIVSLFTPEKHCNFEISLLSDGIKLIHNLIFCRLITRIFLSFFSI